MQPNSADEGVLYHLAFQVQTVESVLLRSFLGIQWLCCIHILGEFWPREWKVNIELRGRGTDDHKVIFDIQIPLS